MNNKLSMIKEEGQKDSSDEDVIDISKKIKKKR
jgi:hypothetical protein